MARQGHNGNSLARQAGIDKGTLSQAINLRCNPKAETRQKIAAVLGVPQSRLFAQAGAA